MTETAWYRVTPGAALTREEREWIRAASDTVAARFPEPVLVHLGVDRGGSLHCSLAGAPDGRVVGVDVDVSRFEAGPVEPGRFELVQGDSRLVHQGFEGDVHFLFVDTDHHDSTVLAELLGWLPKVPAGGIVAFHDYGNDHLRWCKGVKKAVDAWDWSGWEEMPFAGSIRAFRRADAGQG